MPPISESMPAPYVRGYVVKLGRAMGHSEGRCLNVHADCRFQEDVDELIEVLNTLKPLLEAEKSPGADREST